ncbi:MAG: protein kinase [Polyangiaceae bacterium]
MLPEFSEPTDRFALEARAGAGGMGDVFRATDTETGRTVAVKVLRASAGPAERRRFQREIAVIADLRHPNIVEYIAHGTLPDHRLFYAMEWLDGEDLGQRQRHAPLGMRDAVEVIRRSAAAMAAVHARGIVHRDLKLGNIFLVKGKGTAVKLIDFGVVKLPDQEQEDDRGAIIGTPHFMAPEQARGENVDARADVYSLGSALFRLVTGRTVFETEHVIALLGRLVIEDPPSPASIRFDVPEALSNVIWTAISRDREQRLENGGEFARALARVGDLNNDPPATDRSASAVRRAMPARRPPSVEIPPVDPDAERRPKGIRRVVAALVMRVAEPLEDSLESELRETLGDDARIEELYGGQIIAVVGVDRTAGDAAIRAARAALVVTRARPTATAVIAVGHAIAGASPLAGASTGRAGNLAGEALERAAKQLDVAAPGTIRADASVISALGGRFVLSEDRLGAVLLREDQSGFGARLLLGRPTPTVGRDKEINLLTSAYNELLEEGTPRAIVLTGAPGIGKSRVRAEVITRLEASPYPPEVLFGRGEPPGQRGSLSAFGRAVRQTIGVHDGESLKDQVEKVRAHASFRMPKPLRFLTSFLGEVVGVPFPGETDEPLRAARQNAQLMQSRMRMAIEAFVRAQAEVVPQAMFLEDAHWADETTLEIIGWMLGCPDVKFIVFMFARSEFESRLATLWKNKNVTRLTLAPLSPLAAEKLVVKALPHVDGRVRSALVERAGGNVLFLEELIRSTAQGTTDLPLNVQAVVQMRLDRLAPNLRETLRAASVLGQVFWTGAVSALVERDAEADLGELVTTEIVTRHASSRVAGETEWSFRQSLVRDAAYASILEDDRAPLHLVAGSWLERVGDADTGLLAKHADAGRDFARAVELYARATRQAFTNGAHETALELARRGLAIFPEGGAPGMRAQLLLSVAQTSLPLGRLAEGIQAGEQAAELAPRGSDMWAEAERLVAQALIENGRSVDGDQRAARALLFRDGAGEFAISDAMRASILSVRVRGLIDLGKHDEALAIAENAVEIATRVNAPRPLLEALEARLFAIMQSGNPSDVVLAGPRVIEMADTVGDLVRGTRARVNTASSMNLFGLWEDSRRFLQRALTDTRDRQMRVLEAFSLHNLGMCEARLGDFDRGIRMERDAYKIADETQVARLRVHARVYEIMFVLWRASASSDPRADIHHADELGKKLVEVARPMPVLSATAAFTTAQVHAALARLAAGTPNEAAARDLALVSALEAHNKMVAMPVEEWEEATHLTLVDAFLLRGDDLNANRALEAAFRSVHHRTRQIARAEHRDLYTQRIPEIARILTLARDRLGLTLPSAGLVGEVVMDGNEETPIEEISEIDVVAEATVSDRSPHARAEAITRIPESEPAPFSREETVIPSGRPKPPTLPPPTKRPAPPPPPVSRPSIPPAPPTPRAPAPRPSGGAPSHGGVRLPNPKKPQ